MGKIVKLSYMSFALMVLLGSCEGVFNEDIVGKGKFMFWSNFDGPPIDIYVEGIHRGSITSFYTESPACETSGCVTVELEPGTYQFHAVEQPNPGGNNGEWDGTITVRLNACGKLGLTP